MKSNVPFHILHHDEKLLIIQTQSYVESDANTNKNSELSKQMLLENTPSFGEFNLGLHVQDNPSEVLENRCALLAQLNDLAHKGQLDPTQPPHYHAKSGEELHSIRKGLGEGDKIQQIHWLNQVHGSDVLDVDERLIDANSNLTPEDADALTTTQQGQALAIMTADCVPIVLYCRDSGRIAGVHAGWHGLAKGVIANSVNTMNQLISDSKPSHNIQAWIGACISVGNYEVSDSVLEELIVGSLAHFPIFDKLKLDKNKLINKISKPHDNPNKAWIDLPSLVKKQLESMGVEVMTADVKDIPCSYADTKYYSHRRATHKRQGSTGRMAMLVVSL